MKWIIGIALLISIGANGYFVYDEILVKENEAHGKLMSKAMGFDLSKTTWKQGVERFKTKLKDRDKNLANKKYYYINTWAIFCQPCIKEMPWLDSIAGTLNKDVAYIFASDLSDKAANACIDRKNYHLKNFIFLNDMSDFISAICNEQGVKGKSYPMVLILDNKGKVLHYSVGAYQNLKEAAEFSEMINKLE